MLQAFFSKKLPTPEKADEKKDERDVPSLPLSTKPLSDYRHNINEGSKFYENGDFKNAIACYTRAIELNPLYGYKLLYKKGQILDPSYDPELAMLHCNRGNAYYNNNLDAALEDYKEAFKLDPNNSHAIQGLSVINANTTQQKGTATQTNRRNSI